MFLELFNSPLGANMFKQLNQEKEHSPQTTAFSRNDAQKGLLPAIVSAFLFIVSLSTPTLAQLPITLPEGAVNQSYGPVRLSFMGPAASVSWTVSGANPLPSGIVLDARTGVLSGTPTTAGQFDIVLIVTSTTDVTVKGEQRFRMKVNQFALRIELSPAAPPTPPAAIAAVPSNLTPTPTPDKEPSNSDELTISVANVFNPTGVITPGTTDIIDGRQWDLIETLLPGLALEDYCVVRS
jgi:hypothetical protein